MIGGDKMYNDVKGINKLFEIKPNFTWHHINYIESFTYKIDFNDYGDKVSYLDIMFLIEEKDKIEKEILIKFSEVSSFSIQNIGGSYNQLIGFEIIDKKGHGWELDKRYFVRDYENGIINFYCKSIEIVSVT